MGLYDIILKNAKIIDYGLKLNGVQKDIGIKDGKITKISDKIEALENGAEIYDLSDYYVSAGWIDAHVHVVGGLAVRDMQSFGVKSGVVCAFDAGNAGLITLDDYIALIEDSIADIFLMPYMDIAGVPYEGKTEEDFRNLPMLDYIEMVNNNKEYVKGVKFCALGNIGLHNVKIAKILTETTGVPLYMHVGEIDYYPTERKITREAFNVLQAGDIATHIYTGDIGTILDENDQVYPEVLEARDRGVRFDMSYGTGNFTYNVAEKAMAQGIITDILSSDVNNLSYGRDVNLPAIMSRMLLLGMSLEDVIARVTHFPKEIYNLDRHGSLEVGKPAHVTVFSVETGEFPFADCEGVVRTGSKKVVPYIVFKDGIYYECDVEAMDDEDNYHVKYAPATKIGEVALTTEEREFMVQLLDNISSAPDFKGETLHRILKRQLDVTALNRKDILNKIYEIILSKESFGFTPQIGWVLSRFGLQRIKEMKENLLQFI